MVITTARCQSALAVWLEVGGINGRVLIVPRYKQRSCFHGGGRCRERGRAVQSVVGGKQQSGHVIRLKVLA